MFENPRRGRQARNFTTNAPKILDLKSSSEQIFSRKLPLGAPGYFLTVALNIQGVTVNSDSILFSWHKNLGRVIKRHSFHEEKLVLGETNRTGANF